MEFAFPSLRTGLRISRIRLSSWWFTSSRIVVLPQWLIQVSGAPNVTRTSSDCCVLRGSDIELSYLFTSRGLHSDV